jgi:hypothetical protein
MATPARSSENAPSTPGAKSPSAGRSGLLEEHAAKLSKVKALEIMTALEMFQDDAELLRYRDKAAIDDLLGRPADVEGEAMPTSRTTILADGITITHPQAAPTPRPAPAPEAKAGALWQTVTAAALCLGGLAGGVGIAEAVRPDPAPPPAVEDTDTQNTLRFEEPAPMK